jgi:hypothetical protein
MTLCFNRALLVAAAGLMVTLPIGWAAGEETRQLALPVMPAPHTAMSAPCGKRTDVVRMLRDNFGETQIAHGLANTGAVAEVFISAKGTWTIVATSPNGLTCMIGSGESWQPEIAHDGTI